LIQVERENNNFSPLYFDVSIHSTIGLQKWMEEVDILANVQGNRAAASPKMMKKQGED